MLLAASDFIAAAAIIRDPVCPAPGPVEGVTWNEEAARHLLSRAAFGGTPEEARSLAAMPLDQAVDLLLDEAAAASPPVRPEWVRDVWINEGRRWSDMSREEFLIVHRQDNARNQAKLDDLRAWWLEQMISTKTPLRENMTLFWHGHFTSATSKVAALPGVLPAERDLSPLAGALPEFLKAVTLDPAMMAYLDMERSNETDPSENYARELLELFTLGVGNYTEKDMQEVARPSPAGRSTPRRAP